MKTINLLTAILFLIISVFASNEVCKQDKPYLPYFQKMRGVISVDTVFSGNDTNFVYNTRNPILESDTNYSTSKSYIDLMFRSDEFGEYKVKNQKFDKGRRFFIKTNKICGLEPNYVLYTITDNLGNVYIDSISSSYWWLSEIIKDIDNGPYDYNINIKTKFIIEYYKDGFAYKDTLKGMENNQIIKNFSNVSILDHRPNGSFLLGVKNYRDYLGRIEINK